MTTTSTCSSWDSVPVLDLSLADDPVTRPALVRQLDRALRRYGFLYVSQHGVDAALLEEQFDLAHQLFRLPLADKRAMPFDGTLDIGYVGSGQQQLDPDGTVQFVGDTKEQFMMTTNKLIVTKTKTNNEQSTTTDDCTIDPDRVFAGSQNCHPKVPRHAEVTSAYASAAYRLNLRLNALLFDALTLPPDDATRIALGQCPFLVLKQMKYALENPSDVGAGKFGAGAHTDWGSFTILCTDGKPGLQIHMPSEDNKNGTTTQEDRWLPVPHRKGCLIINSGDQIAQLTNDYYRSALHRVVIEPPASTPINNKNDSTNPTTSGDDERSQARFSTAIFTYFGMQAPVGPLDQFVRPAEQNHCKYPPPYRTSQEYFHFKLTESTSGGKGY